MFYSIGCSHVRALLLLIFVLSVSVSRISAQSPTPSPTPSPATNPTPRPSLEKHFISNVLRDQLVIWTTPFKAKTYESKWSIPLGLSMAGLIATDRYSSPWVDSGGSLPKFSHDVSWFGKGYIAGGLVGGFYLTGRFTHNPKARETGILAAQALIDSGIVTRVVKAATQRPRPNIDNGSAEFWHGGDSFPSGHSSTAWSVATVVAYEYKDNPWIKYGAFAGATAVSLSRFSGRNHFLSDVLGGSALGFLIGRYVVNRYHDPDVDSPRPKKKSTTFLHPMIAPYLGERKHGSGVSLVWQL